MSRWHVWRSILAAVLTAVSGCDCQGSGVGEDTDVPSADDGLLVLNATWPEGRIAIFDEATGAWLRDVTPSGSVGPLACFVGP